MNGEAGHNLQPTREWARYRPHRFRRGSVLCVGTEAILGTFLALLGDGDPDQGHGLDRTGSMFDNIGAQIAALDPDGGWRGSAARAYFARNLAQSQHGALMADLDRLVAQLVSSQADAVQNVRNLLCGMIVLVAVMLLVCRRWESLGPGGQRDSFDMAVFICSTLLLVAGGNLIYLAATTSRNSSEVQTATQQLTDMSAALPNATTRSPDRPKWAWPQQFPLRSSLPPS